MKKVPLIVGTAILVLSIVAIPLIKNQVTESKYQQALHLIEQKDWKSAEITLKALQDYKDAKVLEKYVEANTELQSQKENGLIDPLYTFVLKPLAEIPDNYSGQLAEEIKQFRTEITATKEQYLLEANTKNEKRHEQEDEELLNAIKQGDYEEAGSLAYKRNGSLWNYVIALDKKAKGDNNMAVYLLMQIPDDYNGLLADEIKQEIARFKTTPEWQEELQRKAILSQPSELDKPKPKLGMTAQEVLSSAWGKPNDINKTTTSNGVTEQWVYGIGRYIYLQNGVVAAIQE